MKLSNKYKKVIREMALKRFPSEVNTILEKAQRQYNDFWKTTPDIGGRKNMQFKDLDFLIAFFPSMKAVIAGSAYRNWMSLLMRR